VETAIFVAVILLLCVGTYSRNRLWNDEIGLWIDCVKKSPGKARPYINLGVAYFNAGVYDKSLESNRKAIQIDSKSGQAYYNLGLVYQKKGDLTKAIAMEKKSLEVDPTLDLPYYCLGGFYFENGQYEESEKAYQRFLKIYPYFPEVHNLLAIVYAAQKKFDQAVTELEWEIRINPYHTLAHLNLGQIYWHEFQNRQKAIYHLKTALMLDPFFPRRGEIRRLVRQLEGLS
jgi:tetratricopeptide (TPR) repeat protein